MGAGTGGNGVYPASPRDAMETASYLTLLPSVTAFPGQMGLNVRRRVLLRYGRVIFTSPTFSRRETVADCGLRPEHRMCLSQLLSQGHRAIPQARW